LAKHHLALTPYTIPAGLHRLSAPRQPADDVPTLAVRMELLCRAELPASLVEQITRIVLSEDFIRANSLDELFHGGVAFARQRPEFALHRGALNYYEPELRPLLNPDFVEATEGLRSLVFSALIAAYLAFRWFKNARGRRQEHRLDRYIRQLSQIERQQMELDQTEGWCDLERLQAMLDEVTCLRQEALAVFSAHDLNEDRAADSLLEMCHALSDKINAKISRQRLDKRLAELLTAIKRGSGGEGLEG
jgi:hypothetical protein